VSENCRTYDELNGKNSKLTENKHDNNEIGKRGLHRIGTKEWIMFFVVVLLMCIFASVLTSCLFVIIKTPIVRYMFINGNH
jgi:hypothetical protein